MARGTRKSLSIYFRRVNATQVTLYFVLCLACVYRVYYVFATNPMHNIWSDPERHWLQGVNALESSPMALTDPILYQLYLGFLAKLTLGNTGLIAYFTSLLSLSVPWIWYRFFRELITCKTTALGGAALIALMPSWNNIYAYFMQETLLLPLLGLALQLTWRCRRKASAESFYWMIAAWLAAGLTRGICIPLGAVAVIWIWLVQSQKLRRAVIGLTLLAAILGPLTYRAYVYSGVFAPNGSPKFVQLYFKSGMQNIKLFFTREGTNWSYYFTSPSMGAKPLEPLSAWQSARTGTFEASIDMTKGSENWDEAVKSTAFNFDKYLGLAGENLVFLFFGTSWPDSNRAWQSGELNYQMRWIWLPAFLLVLGTGIVLFFKSGLDFLMTLLMISWLLVQGFAPLSVNEGRYRKPMEGLLIANALVILSARRKS